MVGVPRSTGCQICRRRRVNSPIPFTHVFANGGGGPFQGVKYGAECPGYERSHKFVKEKHQVRSKKNRLSSPESSSSTYSFVTSGFSSKSSPRTPASAFSSPPSILSEPVPNRGEFVTTMVETARTAIEERDASGYFSWVRFGTVGSYPILDGALCSLSMHLVGKEVQNDDLIAYSRTLYGQSLNNLQRALRHPTKWKASETLCTAILLCIFELFAGTESGDSWLQHARGIGILMEQRGAKAHRDGWDAAMLLSMRGVLVKERKLALIQH
ncbi:hypothetical protein NQ176_g7697 [Zarea fungicola]|uniref:Uncharacterized protein n=1 Tax=Zarea fungicola TaxID=93591 RepID=A0ACC1MX70_9HYPO|nr:hypothetical protein NQ176_g7697 [Lecanicillium fungicola]